MSASNIVLGRDEDGDALRIITEPGFPPVLTTGGGDGESGRVFIDAQRARDIAARLIAWADERDAERGGQ